MFFLKNISKSKKLELQTSFKKSHRPQFLIIVDLDHHNACSINFLRHDFNWRDVVKKFIICRKMLILMVSTSVSAIKDAPFYWCLYHTRILAADIFIIINFDVVFAQHKISEVIQNLWIWRFGAVDANAAQTNCEQFSSFVSHGEGINLIKGDVLGSFFGESECYYERFTMSYIKSLSCLIVG